MNENGQIAYNTLDPVAECFAGLTHASGNIKIGIITECIQQLIIKLLNVLCIVFLSLLDLMK